MSDERLQRLLQEAPLDGEAEARERSWRVINAAHAERTAAPRPVVSVRRLAIALAATGALLALILTPAGARVVDAVRNATGIGEKNAKPALTSLPAPGSLVVESPVGPWVVHDDGSKRLLGDYEQASWSPHGIYLALARHDELAAITPTGVLHWTIAGKAIGDPSWSPAGNRVAYRSGDALWLAAGDASFHEQLVSSIAPVAPTWRPIAHPTSALVQAGPGVNVLAYVDSENRIVVLDTDAKQTLWTSDPQPRPSELVWSSDGRQLVAVTPRALYTYRGTGTPIVSSVAHGQTIRSAAALPDTHRVVASLRARDPGELRSTSPTGSGARRLTGLGQRQGMIVAGRLDGTTFTGHPLFSAPSALGDPVPSPDGTSILVPWPAADQWVFVDANGGGKLRAVDDISHQFDPKATGPVAFPRVEGWCCSATTADG